MPNSPASLLDNPVWHALTGRHARFAEGDALARRYPAAVTPIAALAHPSPAAYASLARLLGRRGTAGLLFEEPPALPSGFRLVHTVPVLQMLQEAPVPVPDGVAIDDLSPADGAEMLALVQRTQPGPFGPRTPELGDYVGVRTEGRLAAMAGVRLMPDGFTEISAVCTHPAHRGRGYSQALVAALSRRLRERGEVPFLHVRPDNADAVHVYEKLGFRTRRTLYVGIVEAVA